MTFCKCTDYFTVFHMPALHVWESHFNVTKLSQQLTVQRRFHGSGWNSRGLRVLFFFLKMTKSGWFCLVSQYLWFKIIFHFTSQSDFAWLLEVSLKLCSWDLWALEEYNFLHHSFTIFFLSKQFPLIYRTATGSNGILDLGQIKILNLGLPKFPKIEQQFISW